MIGNGGWKERWEVEEGAQIFTIRMPGGGRWRRTWATGKWELEDTMGRAGGWRESALETCWAALCRDVQGCRLDIGATAQGRRLGLETRTWDLVSSICMIMKMALEQGGVTLRSPPGRLQGTGCSERRSEGTEKQTRQAFGLRGCHLIGGGGH